MKSCFQFEKICGFHHLKDMKTTTLMQVQSTSCIGSTNRSASDFTARLPHIKAITKRSSKQSINISSFCSMFSLTPSWLNHFCPNSLKRSSFTSGENIRCNARTSGNGTNSSTKTTHPKQFPSLGFEMYQIFFSAKYFFLLQNLSSAGCISLKESLSFQNYYFGEGAKSK